MTPASPLRRSWSGSHGTGACSSIVEPSSGSWGRSREKKTPYAHDAAVGAFLVLDPASFCTAGGDVQAQYESRRMAFLAWASQADDEARAAQAAAQADDGVRQRAGLLA